MGERINENELHNIEEDDVNKDETTLEKEKEPEKLETVADNDSQREMLKFLQQLQEFCQKPASSNNVSHTSITDDQALERFLKFHPPRFMGEPDDRKAESFIAEIEKIFEVLSYTDTQKIKYASYRLEDAARHWWAIVN